MVRARAKKLASARGVSFLRCQGWCWESYRSAPSGASLHAGCHRGWRNKGNIMSKGNISLGTKAWAERLNAAYDRVTATWQSSVENIIALGKELLAAREALPKGEFTNMIHNELKFSAATATRVIKIAESDQIFSHVKILPPIGARFTSFLA